MSFIKRIILRFRPKFRKKVRDEIKQSIKTHKISTAVKLNMAQELMDQGYIASPDKFIDFLNTKG